MSFQTDGFQVRYLLERKDKDEDVEEEEKEKEKEKEKEGEKKKKPNHIINLIVDPGKIYLIAGVFKISGLTKEEIGFLEKMAFDNRKDDYLLRVADLWRRYSDWKGKKKKEKEKEQEDFEEWVKKAMDSWEVEELDEAERKLLAYEMERMWFKSKHSRAKFRRKMMKRTVLLANPNFSSYLLSGAQWRFWLNPTKKPKKTKNKKKRKREREKKRKEEKEKWKEKASKEEIEIGDKEENEEVSRSPPERNRPHPALRLKRFRNHQKAVTNTANGILERAKDLYKRCFPEEETLPPIRLLWGDGKFSHTGHHHPPCPNKGLQESLAPFFKVRVVPEKFTTQASPCCDDLNTTKAPVHRVKLIDVCCCLLFVVLCLSYVCYSLSFC